MDKDNVCAKLDKSHTKVECINKLDVESDYIWFVFHTILYFWCQLLANANLSTVTQPKSTSSLSLWSLVVLI